MKKQQRLLLIVLLAAVCLAGCREAAKEEEQQVVKNHLEIGMIGPQYEPSARTLIAQLESDQGGSTSIRNNQEEHLIWKSKGYYQRNRDLGQIFTLEQQQDLRAVILRTGPSDKAVLAGAPGSELFIQFFEVRGTPEVNDNGTPPGTDALHGFSTNHRCDDYIEGVEYVAMPQPYAGEFPDVPPTYNENGPTNDSTGNMQFLRFSLEPPLTLGPGQYAFIVGFTEPGNLRGLTFANANRASLPDAPAIGDSHDLYGGGWGIRREGNGKVPPTMLDQTSEPADETLRKSLQSESLFPDGAARFAIAPTTDGYPDVDTYRDLTFALEIDP